MSENHEKSWKWMLGAIVAVAILAVFFTRNRKPTIDEQVEAIKNHKSIPFLIQKLSDPNPRIRDAATARLFLWLPHEDAHFKQLMKLKTVSSIRILGSAIREDKKDGPDVDVVRYLINLLDEKESDEIRIAAIEELGLTRSELAERPLRRLQNADRDLEVASIRALWRITDRSQGLTERLLILAAQADSKKREPIDILFGNMSMKAFDDLVQATWTSLPADQRALESKVQRLARHYLARLGEQAVPKMIARLKNPSEYSFAKEGIIDALGEMGEKAKDCEPVLVTFIKLRPDEVQFQSATREPAIAWVATAITLTRNQGAGVSAFLAPLTSQGLFDALKRSLALREKMRLHVRRRLRQAALQALPKVGVASRVAVGELLKLWAITESDLRARYSKTLFAITGENTNQPDQFYAQSLPAELPFAVAEDALPLVERLLARGTSSQKERAIAVLGSFREVKSNCDVVTRQLWNHYLTLPARERTDSSTELALKKTLPRSPGFVADMLSLKNDESKWKTLSLLRKLATEVKPMIVALLESRDRNVRGHATEALIRDAHQPNDELVSNIVENLLDEKSAFQSSTVDLLIAHFTGKTPLIHKLHESIKKQRLDGKLVRWLGLELSQKSEEIKTKTLTLILRGPSNLVGDPKPYDDPLVKAILPLTQSTDENQKQLAEKALAHVSPIIVKARSLGNRARDESLDLKSRFEALTKLEKMGTHFCEPFLASLTDPDVANAASALASQPSKDLPNLLKSSLFLKVLSKSLSNPRAPKAKVLQALTHTPIESYSQLQPLLPAVLRQLISGREQVREWAGKLVDHGVFASAAQRKEYQSKKLWTMKRSVVAQILDAMTQFEESIPKQAKAFVASLSESDIYSLVDTLSGASEMDLSRVSKNAILVHGMNRAIKEKDESTQINAMRVAAKLPKDQKPLTTASLVTVVKLFNSEEASIKAIASNVLSRFAPDAKKIPELIATAKKGMAFLRIDAMQKLGDLGPIAESALPALSAIASSEDEASQVRATAREAIKMIMKK